MEIFNKIIFSAHIEFESNHFVNNGWQYVHFSIIILKY